MVFTSYVLSGKTWKKAAVYFFEVEYTTESGVPHSKQRAFNRDVINPQDGHIICDWTPANCGFSLRLQRSGRIVNRAMSRPRKILVALIKATLQYAPAAVPLALLADRCRPQNNPTQAQNLDTSSGRTTRTGKNNWAWSNSSVQSGPRLSEQRGKPRICPHRVS